MKYNQFLIVTLGCFRNEVESDMLRTELVALGLEETRSLESADLVIINTCGFISEACDETIDTVLELDEAASRLPRRPPILAVGCMGQRYGVELMREMPELDGVLGVNWKTGLREAVGELMNGGRYGAAPPPPGGYDVERKIDSSQGATLFVRVSDGCGRRCRFCSIPSIRGEYRSRPIADIQDEIKRLSGGRDREVILLAQDLTGYGSDTGAENGLVDLIRCITAIPEVRWLRLLYLQPEGVTAELVEEVASNPGVCSYFDIPFQHASSTVLSRMGRPGDARSYLQLLESIRDRVPEAAIRTTVMVGYPGETEGEFTELIEFIETARFDWLGAFIFSAEEGTPAASMSGQVPNQVSLSRYNKVLGVQGTVEESITAAFPGRKLEVVVDGVAENELYDLVGRSYREAPEVDGAIYLRRSGGESRRVNPGDFTLASIVGWEGLDLVGEI
jgi:ribosomal protein S12 methylthiotransferase